MSCWGHNSNGQVMLVVLFLRGAVAYWGEGVWLLGGEVFVLLTRCFAFVCRLATAARRSVTRPFLFLVWAAGSR